MFSLALGGWAARWLAHIGVIRRLEELGMRPTAISGTSIGAIIGTLYALGKTSQEMEAMIANVSWMKLVDPDLKKWVIKGAKVEKYLDTLFEGKSFSDLLIPLAITATNIDTGEWVTFRDGKLSEVVRASISLPGVFIPKGIDGHMYVDGGITNNLPIESLPPWRVIAISALRDITKVIRYKRRLFGIDWSKSIVGNTYSIMRKTIDIIIAQNESRSILSREDILYIRPSFDTLDYYNFDKYREFIQAGYETGKISV